MAIGEVHPKSGKPPVLAPIYPRQRVLDLTLPVVEGYPSQTFQYCAPLGSQQGIPHYKFRLNSRQVPSPFETRVSEAFGTEVNPAFREMYALLVTLAPPSLNKR